MEEALLNSLAEIYPLAVIARAALVEFTDDDHKVIHKPGPIVVHSREGQGKSNTKILWIDDDIDSSRDISGFIRFHGDTPKRSDEFIDLPLLAKQFHLLHAELHRHAVQSDHFRALTVVNKSEELARQGDESALRAHLVVVDNWVLDESIRLGLFEVALAITMSREASIKDGQPLIPYHTAVNPARFDNILITVDALEGTSLADKSPQRKSDATAWHYIREEVFQLLCTNNRAYASQRKQLQAGGVVAVSFLSGLLVHKFGMEAGTATNLAVLALALPLKIGIRAWGKAYQASKGSARNLLLIEQEAVKQLTNANPESIQDAKSSGENKTRSRKRKTNSAHDLSPSSEQDTE